MNANFIVFGILLPWLIVAVVTALGAWIGFQLIEQNGRLLGRLEGLEQRLSELSTAQPVPQPAAVAPAAVAPAPAPAAPEGLPLGSPAPAFELPDLAGTPQRLAGFRGKKLLLIFFNPRCGFCSRMVPDLAALPVDGRDGRPIPLLVTTGDAEENRKLLAEQNAHCPVLLQQQMEVAGQYRCSGTPMGYLIDEQGRIASELAIGAPALLALAADDSRQASDASGNGAGPLGGKRGLEESKIQRDGLPAGTPAPDFRLPLLYGGELSLSEYRGRPVLLVFSDPSCAPCDQLMPRLEQQYRASREVQVLMISRGEEAANRAKAAQHGLTFPVVLQRQWEISREYAKFATPVAYLVDEAGRIAKEAAVGVEPILALLSVPEIPANGRARAHRAAREPVRRG